MVAMFKKEQVSGVVFYCKDCERIVETRQVGRRFVYSCNICKTKNVAFGTEKSIRSFFHYDEVAGAPGVEAGASGTKASEGTTATGSSSVGASAGDEKGSAS